MLKASMPDQLVLERTEEAFHRRIVVTIALAIHTGHHPAPREHRLIETRAILVTLIAMMNQSRCGASALPRHPPGLRHNGESLAWTHRPAHNPARGQI